MSKVTVLGAGSWGTALASLLAARGEVVTLWSFEEGVVERIRETGENPDYLPGVVLPPTLRATGDLAEAVRGAPFVVSVSPSQFVRSVMTEVGPSIEDGAILVSATKGIELDTLRRMDEVIEEAVGERVRGRVAALSGPSFAAEVARGEPTAVVAAAADPAVAVAVQRLFQTQSFRVYTSNDVVGVQLGGAVKNVIALAAGATAGLGFGHNTMAALITRGLAEITRLGVAVGAQASTFAGLAGLGDLVLTCTGDLSRNRTVGFRLGRGESLEAVLGDMHHVAEGVRTTRAVRDLAARHGVEMPITEEVHQILTQGKAPSDAVLSLMTRDPKPEAW